MSGALHGIGVGPGDPELITLKAHRLLQEADLIAYPSPESGDSLARSIVAVHLPPGVEEYAIRMPMVAERFPAQAVYEQASRTLSTAINSGRRVVVLCEGDPFFYGSFMYLFARLAKQYPIEVVPGVSSLTACAARSAIPLVARNETLVVLPAPLDDAILEDRLASTDAAVLVKIGRHLPRIRSLLQRMGLADRSRYVERATMENERILSLDDIAGQPAPYFSTIVVHRRGELWTVGAGS